MGQGRVTMGMGQGEDGMGIDPHPPLFCEMGGDEVGWGGGKERDGIYVLWLGLSFFAVGGMWW